MVSPNSPHSKAKEVLGIKAIHSERFRRLSKEVIWIVVGQFAMVLGSLVLVRVLTEHLDAARYGQLALGLTVAGLVNQVVMGGVSAGIGRFYSIAVEKQDLHGYLRASRHLMTYATLAVLAIGVTLLCGLLFLGYSQWMGLAAAALVLAVMSGYNSTLSGIQNAARQRPVVAFHGGLDAGLKILLAVGLMLWLGSSSTAVVVGYAFSSLLVTGSQLIFLRRFIASQPATSGHGTQWGRQMWVYSWPLAVGGLFNWGYYASQRWALELFATTSEVGQFYALTQVGYTPISIAGGMILSFLTPILFARAGDATDHDRLDNAYRLVIQVAAVGLAITIGVAAASYLAHSLIFRFLVAAEYRTISRYMPFVVIAAGILQVSIACSSIVTVAKQTAAFLPVAIIGNGVVVLLNVLFTKQWGLDGLIGSMVAGSCLHLTWMILIVSRHVKQMSGDNKRWD